MLINSSTHAIDTKGRIFFPVRFRDDMWEKIVICRGKGKFLMLFSPEEWTNFTDGFNYLKNTDRDKLRRYFFSLAAEVSVDSQGRILLPQNLREFAGLKKDVVVTGMQDHAEIWDSEEWDRIQSEVDESDITELWDSIPHKEK